MGTLKRTNVKFDNDKRSVQQINENEDIDRLIEEEIREEERKTHQLKEIEDHTKNTALKLVNEFIENETRSSFNRKVKKSKTTGGAGKTKKSTTTDIQDSGTNHTESKEKTKKVKKSKTADYLDSDTTPIEGKQKTKKVKKLIKTDSLDSGTTSGADTKTSDTTTTIKPKTNKKKKTTKAKKGGEASSFVIIDMKTEHPSTIDEGELEEVIVTPRAPEDIPVVTESKEALQNKKTKTTTTEGKKTKKKKTTPTWEIFEDEETQYSEIEENGGQTQKKNLKTKGGGGGKKKNKISPTPPPEDNANTSSKGKGNKLKTKLSKDLVMESFSDDNMLDDQQQQPKTTENSCLTIVLMALCLESELPIAFYNKLVRSRKFKDALMNLNAEERALVLVMMDDMSPSVDCLPNSNGIFIDRFKDRLSVTT